MKQQVLLAARLYECQKSAQFLKGDKYISEITDYVGFITAVMKQKNCTDIQAVFFLAELDSVKDNGVALMMIMAAYVELVENPIFKTVKQS